MPVDLVELDIITPRPIAVDTGGPMINPPVAMVEIFGGTVPVTPTGGAPTNAHYVTTQSEPMLSSEFNLGALGNGLLKQTVVSGVSTPAIATPSVDYTVPADLPGFIDSVIDTAGSVSLVNDLATPGASKHYGTDGSGVRGWIADPVIPTIPNFIDSIVLAGGNVSLVNDLLTPGADVHYGTDGAGVRGWQADDSYIDSIQEVSGQVSLVGDVVTPGASMRYGTDNLGARGWQPAPPLPAGNYLISGGGAAWTGTGLVYQVSAATYVIAGTQYSSAQTTVTLAAADPSQDRIDVIAVDNTGSVVVITGTPGGPPISPSIDPTSQLELTFVYVPAGATAPPVTNVNVYLENTEWTSSVNAGTINPASTNNPYAGTKDIEATAAVAGNYVNLLDPSGSVLLSNYQNLVLQIRSKASWPSQKSLSVFWLAGASTLGNAVTLKQGTFGFNTGNTTGYQQIVIPVSLFNPGNGMATALRIQVAGGGGSIGWYIDNIVLQGGGGAPPPSSGGDFSTNTSTSSPREFVLFADTTGKLGTHQAGLTPESLLALADFNGGSL